MRIRSGALIGIVLASAACGVAVAAQPNWQVMIWTDPLTVSIDTASITTAAARTTARVKWDYSDERTTLDAAATPYRSMMGVVAFDCSSGRFGAVSGTSYAGDDLSGPIVAHYAIRPDQAELSNPAPGTIGQDMVSLVCSAAANAAG
jgi:hypothetical protein